MKTFDSSCVFLVFFLFISPLLRIRGKQRMVEEKQVNAKELFQDSPNINSENRFCFFVFNFLIF